MSILNSNKWVIETTLNSCHDADRNLAALKQKLEIAEQTETIQAVMPILCAMIDSVHATSDNATSALDLIDQEPEQKASPSTYHFTTFRKKGKAPLEEIVEVVDE